MSPISWWFHLPIATQQTISKLNGLKQQQFIIYHNSVGEQYEKSFCQFFLGSHIGCSYLMANQKVEGSDVLTHTSGNWCWLSTRTPWFSSHGISSPSRLFQTSSNPSCLRVPRKNHPTCKHLTSLQSLPHLLMFHWTKHVMWPSSEAMFEGTQIVPSDGTKNLWPFNLPHWLLTQIYF